MCVVLCVLLSLCVFFLLLCILWAVHCAQMRKMREEVSIANQNCELATEKMDHMMQEVAKELNKVFSPFSCEGFLF